MTNFATIHGFEFSVEAQGFGNQERDRDLCVNRLWGMMERMKPENVARLHAALIAADADDSTGEHPEQASRLCNAAIAMQCRRWHRTDDLWLNLNAVPAPTAEEIADQERRAAARKALTPEFERHMQQRPSGHPRGDWQGRFWSEHGL
jgi:hypothetical protein